MGGRAEEGAIASATHRSIVDRARTGDLGAFEELVRSRMDAVYRLTLAIVGNEADAADATQETFIAAWRQLPRLREPEHFEAWLQRIAVNAARMTLRARGRRRVREIPTPLSRATEPATEPFGAEPSADGARLAEALDRLTADQRALLALHHLDGRSIAEIAAVLEIPAGTVKSRLYAARRGLDAALGAEAAE